MQDRPWDVFKQKIPSKSVTNLTHMSLFSGCGGFDLGFSRAGFRTIFANDLDQDACETFEANLGHIEQGNITSPEVQLPSRSVRPDVLTAGFPCQPFSNAGSRRGILDDRGSLYSTALHLVERYRPRSVVFENVRGLLSTHSHTRPLIEEICDRLVELDYRVVFALVDASQHNVPQRRLRLLIVAMTKGENGQFAFPPPVERDDLTIGDTILDLKGDEANQSDIIQLNPQAIAIGALVPPGGSWKSIPYEKLPPRLQRIHDNIARYRWPNFYRKFSSDEVAGTVTAAFKPENAGVWHPVKKRPLSVREIARIQTFPDWFTFHGRNVKSMYRQIGNAVPPRLAFDLATRLRKALEGEMQNSGGFYENYELWLAKGKPLRAKDGEIFFEPAPRAFEACHNL